MEITMAVETKIVPSLWRVLRMSVCAHGGVIVTDGVEKLLLPTAILGERHVTLHELALFEERSLRAASRS
jgi:hypothetical protein